MRVTIRRGYGIVNFISQSQINVRPTSLTPIPKIKNKKKIRVSKQGINSHSPLSFSNPDK